MAEIPFVKLPGPFVVLQGMPGDGMSNTMDSMPYLPEHVDDGSVSSGSAAASASASASASPLRNGKTSGLYNGSIIVDGEDRNVSANGTSSSAAGGMGSSSMAMSLDMTTSAAAAAGGEDDDLDESGFHHVPPPAQAQPPIAAAESGSSNNSTSEDMVFLPDQNQHHNHVSMMIDGQDSTATATAAIASPPRNRRKMQSAAETDTPPPSAAASSQSSSQSPAASPVPMDTKPAAAAAAASQSPQERHKSQQKHREHASVQQWKQECREREKLQLDEVAKQWETRRKVGGPTSDESRQSSSSPGASAAFPSSTARSWWQRNGRIAVFASPIVHKYQSAASSEEEEKNTEEDDDVEDVLLLGTLSPGTVVRGCELVPAQTPGRSAYGTDMQMCSGRGFAGRRQRQMNQKLLKKQGHPATGVLTGGSGSSSEESSTQYTFLRIEAPMSGFVLYKRGEYLLLGPGLPTEYCNPSTWIWRVTCPDGAYVRSGLELNSPHLSTVPYGVLVQVTRKTVNAMGLSRLRLCRAKDNIGTSGGSVGDAMNSESLSSLGPSLIGRRPGSPPLLEGWISEALNPLSGQRGPIAQPMPFPVPALYRVTLPDGAVVRSGIELSSIEVRVAPFRSIIKVVGRAFSEHPMDQCIERLQLAGGGGWVSVRLNRPPPLDVLIVELIGTDESFDPDQPGLYHLGVQEELGNQRPRSSSIPESGGADVGGQRARAASLVRLGEATPSLAAASGAAGAAEGERRSSTSSLYSTKSSTDFRSAAVGSAGAMDGKSMGTSTTNRGKGGSTTSLTAANNQQSSRKKHFGKHSVNEEKCLICLIEERTATIVHGETGHIACCLACARILKARGDKCPVCRLPIDLVIQQFWA